MAETVIQVEHLSKCYIIGHKQTRHSYVALRDIIADTGRRITGRFLHPLRGDPSGSATTEEFWALDDVSFEVRQGDRLGIIGGNGAGKSTLLKVLSRIVEPTKGRITLHGRIASLLEVGTGFHPELTGRENIYLNGAILGMTNQEIRRKFDEIVSFAEVEQFLDTPVKRYSSGMYVRLAFAVAAHLEPEILIVDEVLAVGDAQFQKKCLGKMEEVGKEGRTVLFVSHNMTAIEQLCDNCILVRKGRIERHGKDVRSIIKEYLFGENQDQKRSEWVNSGSEFENPWFKPLRFGLRTEQGAPQVNPVRNDEDIWLEVEGAVREIHPALGLEYTVFTDDGALLYHSSTMDFPENALHEIEPGVHRVKTRIPRRFLNEADYRIDLTIFLHNVQFVTQYGVNAPSIFLVVQGGLSDSPLWASKRPGLVAPVIEWTLVRRESAVSP